MSLMRHKLPFLYGVDLRQALAPRIGCDPVQVRFLNDADAYLLGEVGAGAAKGFGRAVGLTLGTGIGSAFAVDGRLVTPGPGVPKDGEIWNVPYEMELWRILSPPAPSPAIMGVVPGEQSQWLRSPTPCQTSGRAGNICRVRASSGQVIGSSARRFSRRCGSAGRRHLPLCHLFLPVTRAEIPDRGLQIRVSECSIARRWWVARWRRLRR